MKISHSLKTLLKDLKKSKNLIKKSPPITHNFLNLKKKLKPLKEIYLNHKDKIKKSSHLHLITIIPTFLLKKILSLEKMKTHLKWKSKNSNNKLEKKMKKLNNFKSESKMFTISITMKKIKNEKIDFLSKINKRK
jgi:hypothetical protein